MKRGLGNTEYTPIESIPIARPPKKTTTYAIWVFNPINKNWFKWARDIETKERAEEIAKEGKPLLEVRVEVREE